MTPTTPPAAAAVEKIVRECAENILHDYHKEVWQNEQTYDHMRLTPNLERHIQRAIADAIAATGAREALQDAQDTLHALSKIHPASVGQAWDEVGIDQALANLDAVTGKTT